MSTLELLQDIGICKDVAIVICNMVIEWEQVENKYKHICKCIKLYDKYTHNRYTDEYYWYKINMCSTVIISLINKLNVYVKQLVYYEMKHGHKCKISLHSNEKIDDLITLIDVQFAFLNIKRNFLGRKTYIYFYKFYPMQKSMYKKILKYYYSHSGMAIQYNLIKWA